MIDENDREMTYDWSTPNEPWQALHPVPGFATLCAALELQQHDYMHYGSNFMGPRSAAYRFPTG